MVNMDQILSKIRSSKWLQYIGIVLVGCSLIALRFIFSALHLEPLHAFFDISPPTKDFPTDEIGVIWWFSLLKYLSNSLLSILLLAFIYPYTTTVKLGFKLYSFLGLGLFTVYTIMLFLAPFKDYYFFFFTRRIILHPILTLILIPGFYQFYNRKDNTN